MADYNGGQPRAQFRSFWSHAKICRNWHGRKLRLGFGRKRPTAVDQRRRLNCSVASHLRMPT
jgi:hypothetical protein